MILLPCHFERSEKNLLPKVRLGVGVLHFVQDDSSLDMARLGLSPDPHVVDPGVSPGQGSADIIHSLGRHVEQSSA
jgi:hypothetical protein